MNLHKHIGEASASEPVSILRQTWQEGFQEGLKHAKDHQNQVSQIRYDDSYHQGFEDGALSKSRMIWFFLGVVAGVLATALIFSWS